MSKCVNQTNDIVVLHMEDGVVKRRIYNCVIRTCSCVMHILSAGHLVGGGFGGGRKNASAS